MEWQDFNSDLKALKDSDFLISNSKLFHSLGAAQQMLNLPVLKALGSTRALQLFFLKGCM